jgi:hypothetical protein
VWVTIATGYRLLLIVGGASVGALQALVANKVVSWSPWVVVTVASVVGGIAALDNVRLLFHKLRMHEREVARSKMHKPLVGALNAVATARNIPLEKLGISVFAIRPRLGRRYVILPWRRGRLKRVFRFRLSDYPPRSEVQWTEGKGTIGQCWSTGVKAFHDRRPVAARYGAGHSPDEAQYRLLTHEEHNGFTLEEFRQTVDKYGEIIAVPIRRDHSGKMVGVLSIDCLASAYPDDQTTILAGADIEEIAGGAAFTVGADIPRF